MTFRHTIRRYGATVVACLGITGLMISCDSDFDLSNINTDITVGGSIAAPIGTTDTLTVSRLINLTDHLVVDEDGAYALTTDGNTQMDINRVDPIDIKNMSAAPAHFSIDVPLISGTLPSVSLTTPVHVAMDIDALQNLPVEVEKLSHLSISPVATNIVFRLSAPGLSKISNAEVKNFTIDFPDLIEFGSGIAGMDYATNRLTLNRKFAADGSLSVSLPIIGLRQLPEIKNHQMAVKEQVVCDGTFDGTATNVSYADLQGMELTLGYDVPDFRVTDITGTVNANVEINPQTIAMGDLPDIVTDEETSLNLNAVCLILDVTNPVGIPFNADMKLRALDKNGNYINETVTARVSLAAAGSEPKVSQILITNNEKFSFPGYTKVMVPNLSALLRKVPDRIEITATVAADKSVEHHLVLGQPYKSGIDYHAYVPFDFGEGSRIVYRETINDLADDMKDFSDKVKNLEVEVDANIFSTLPFAAAITMTPRDAQGADLSDVLDYTKFVTIDPGAEGQAAQKRTITFKEKEEGALARLDKLEVVVEGNTNDAVAILKPTQYVVVGLTARLPKGVTIKN